MEDNKYGLQFLNHTERVLGSTLPGMPAPADARSAAVKFAEIVDLLKANQQIVFTAEDIREQLEVDLEGRDNEVLQMLHDNAKVIVSRDMTGSTVVKYRSTFNISSKEGLKFEIERAANGVKRDEITGAYPRIEEDLEQMIRSGEIISLRSQDRKVDIFFLRGQPFLCKLPGEVIAAAGDEMITTTVPLMEDIRRGDAIGVGGNWFRVSSKIRQNGQQPERARAPRSVSSIKDMSERNEYIEPFDEEQLPLDHEYDGAQEYDGPAFKHGCTNDLRIMWADTIPSIPTTARELQERLLAEGLITQAAQISGRTVVQNQTEHKGRKRPKQRRQRAQITNLHLQGTAQWDAVMKGKF